MSLAGDFHRARGISTPIIAITTADQENTIKTLTAEKKEEPLVRYDVARGFAGLNEVGCDAILNILEGDLQMNQLMAEDPARAMIASLSLPEDSILFFLNAQKQVSESRVAQAIACMRDRFKSSGRSIVLLAPQIVLPEQVAGDVMILDDPLPESKEIEKLLNLSYEYTRASLPENITIPDPDEETTRKAIEAVSGLHAAAIEQAFSFSMKITGIDLPSCWAQKRSRIEQTRGLSFYRGGETYEDIGGLQAFKDFMTDLYHGPEPFRLIVWLDEIEKAMAAGSGYSGDGGVAADQLGCILSHMEDNEWTGAIAVGPPGAGKSYIAKATGNTFGVPCIRMDLGAVKGSLVGESEQLVRQMLKVVMGIAGRDAFFIATSNGISALPPELIRRFSLGGTWFFDIPTEEERVDIWRLNRARYHIPEDQPAPNDIDWSGSDVRDCCRAAYRRNKSLVDTAEQIVPFCKKDPERLRQLRENAHDTYLSASHMGVYRMSVSPNTAHKKHPAAAEMSGGRRISLS